MGKAIRWLEDNSRLIFLLLLPVFIGSVDCYSSNSHFSFCLFRFFTGMDCYGCGLLRGLSAVLHLDPARLIALNPLNIVTVPLLISIYLRELIGAGLAGSQPFRLFPDPEKPSGKRRESRIGTDISI